MRLAVTLTIAIVLVAGGATYYTKYISAEPPANFSTVTVTRDNLLATIAATGTIEPEDVVDVGAQVFGKIKDLGIDPSELKGRKLEDIPAEEFAKLKRVDFGSVVHPGMLLAQIDDSVYRAQRDQAKATYDKSLADLNQLKAKLIQAGNDRKRAEKLRKITGIQGTTVPVVGIAESDYDMAVANDEFAKANVEIGKATISQSKASLDLSEVNLGYATIRSPVEGVIIARRVNIGQTVAGGSFNAASMFLIAKDLSKMQVWAQVNEADIGRIRSQKGHARPVHSRRLSRRSLSRQGSPNPLGCPNESKRGSLHCSGCLRQLRSETPAIHDRQPEIRGRGTQRRPC